jgi:hypothetical protein
MRRHILLVAFALASGAIAAAEPPPPEDRAPAEERPPSSPAAPSSQVYVYPAHGQSPERTDRDRYECHNWAVRQSGFDPSQPHLAPHQRVQVVMMPPPGTNTMSGAIAGAIVGAAVSRPRDSGTGAAVGAVAGALLGHASDKAREREAARLQQMHDARADSANARLEQQSNDYRRAISACLEARGYTVK